MLKILVIFCPLVGAAISAAMIAVPSRFEEIRLKSDFISKTASSLLIVCSAICSFFVFTDVALNQNYSNIELFTWIDSGAFEVSWALKIDTLTAVMMVVVTTVSAMVHIYSIGYMAHDKSIPRFMSYLSLFTFFMLMLVSSDNLIQLFFGWEGVGLASYLLIGFWHHKPSANSAAIKAFIVNRVGDFGFALGIFTIFLIFDTVQLDTIFLLASSEKNSTINLFGTPFHAITICCILLFIGAMGKSAQLGLHTWLPDAMEGPTPVSALIHAATMVTAGVFLIARMSPLFEYSDTALTFVTIIGGSTAIFAATIACVQTDIKRVIAYSTCSQLGYMFFACGVSAYSAGIFHLMTHGFFKALLFLGAGSIIHAMSDEQDMRKMGGIWKIIPVSYSLMWIGSLALSGIPPFSGYYSKDIILEAAYAADTWVGDYAFCVGIITALLTAFYSWRLLFMTFHGASRADEKTLAHVHESPKIMIIPLFILSIGACFSGYLGFENFVGQNSPQFWDVSLFTLDRHSALQSAYNVPLWVKYLPVMVAVFGIGLAFLFYIVMPTLPGLVSSKFNNIYTFVYHKWYFDELYNKIFVRPIFFCGKALWKIGDGVLIDGLGPDGISNIVRQLSKQISKIQSGYLYHYAFIMLIGLVSIITWCLYSFAG